MIRLLMLLAGLLLVAPAVWADEGDALPPPEALAEAWRAEVAEVSAESTVVARIPPRDVVCGQSTFTWLLGRLPLAAKALRALELGDYGIEDGPGGSLTIDDRAGAHADCYRAFDEQGGLVMVAQGWLDVPVLPKILGTGVILIRWVPDAEQSGVLRCRGRVWFRLRSRLLHLATRVFRKTLAQVLERKLDVLIQRAIALAEAVDQDASAVMVALQRAGEASSAELSAFRERFLLH